MLDIEEGMFNLFNVDETESKAYPLNVQLEYKLFDSVSTPDLLEGVLYILPIYYQEKLFIRYICSGSYSSILPEIIKLVQTQFNSTDRNTYPWQLYTEMDIQMNCSRIGIPHHYPTTYNRKIGCQNSSKSNKNNVFSLLNKCKATLEETYSILFIHKRQANPNNPTHRYVILKAPFHGGGTSPHQGAGTSPFFLVPLTKFVRCLHDSMYGSI